MMDYNHAKSREIMVVLSEKCRQNSEKSQASHFKTPFPHISV